MMIEDEELRDIFKATSEEHLQNLDNGLLHLEKCPDDQPALEALMREAHSLKGDANMLGVKDVGTLAHQIEHILSQLQHQKIAFSQELGDRLADGIVAIRKLVHEAVTGDAADVDTFRTLAILMGASRQNQTEVDTEPGNPVAEFEQSLEAEKTHEIVASQQDESIAFMDTPDLSLGSVDTGVPLEPVLSSTSNLESSASEQCDRTFSPAEKPLEVMDINSIAYQQSTLNSLNKNLDAEPTSIKLNNQYRIETIRVKTRSLDTLMTQVGELTVTKIRVAHRLAEVEAIANLWEECSRELLNQTIIQKSGHSHDPLTPSHNTRPQERLEQLGQLISRLRSTFSEDTTRLDHITDQLEEDIRTLRLLPISTILNLFPRMVRDLARQEGKQVELVIEGGETSADKRILEDMKDPLMHLIRNAIDHGIETPEERVRAGKPETATIKIRCYQTSTHIVIEIQDDGKGLNLNRIKQTAVKRDICREEDLATMTDNQIESLIFTPGFSTAPLVTEVSGRGVGLDVVQTNVEKLKGSIQVESQTGQGCLFRIQLGMTLATAHVLIVSVHHTPYAIPVEAISTTCLVRPEEIFTMEGRETIAREGQPISVIPLADLLELPVNPTSTPLAQSQQLICVVLQVGRQRFGVFVDELVDEQDVVIKPQTGLLKRVRNVAGATILGTGEVCIVLNPQDLVKSIQRRAVSIPVTTTNQPSTQKHTILLVEDSIATRTQEKRMLESAGYEVVTAIDGNDGFSKLQSRPFDAVISDVQMPNLDGLQLTAKVRQLHQFDEIPIILVTSLASDEDKRRGAEAGANAYITKSTLNQQLLVETLQRLM